MSDNVEAVWSVALYVECPECEESFDLNDDGEFTDGTKGHALECLKDVDVECPNQDCGHKFKADLAW